MASRSSSSPPVVLGIDPGTKCGWAALDTPTGQRLASGVWDISIRPGEGAGFREVRFISLLRQLLNAYPDAVVFYEAPVTIGTFAGGSAAELSGALRGLLRYHCETRRPAVAYAPVNISTVKRIATGSGNAKKGRMVLAANAKWPPLALRVEPGPINKKTGKPTERYPNASDNEADALWIAETGRQQYLA